MNLLRLSVRLLRRDLRAPELWLLLIALVLAVAAVTAVSLFTGRLQAGLELRADTWLGGQLALVSDRPIRAAQIALAQHAGVRQVQVVNFPSMVGTGEERYSLSAIEAVDAGYPLLGELKVEREGRVWTVHAPAAGTVYADTRLAEALGVQSGDVLQVGELGLRLAGILRETPGLTGGMMDLAPRLLMNRADLAASGLLGAQARSRHRLLFSGDAAAISRLRAQLERDLHPGERVQTPREARPELRNLIRRASQYLGLSALASVVLAAAGVALSAQRFARQRLYAGALLRSLGATQRQVFRIYAFEFLWLGVLAGLLGVALGALVQAGLEALLAQLLRAPLPPLALAWRAIPHGLLLALLLLYGFSLPPLLRLRQVPPLAVLNRRQLPPAARTWVAYLAGFAVLAALLFDKAGDPRLWAWTLAALCGGVLLTALCAWLLVRLAAYFGRQPRNPWCFGLGGLARRGGVVVVQAVALSAGLMALLLLSLVREDLLASWRNTLPADAPNRFVLNIEPQQAAQVKQFLTDRSLPPPALYPMIRGRLRAINGKPINPQRHAEQRAQRLAEREFNLSYAPRPPVDNRIVAGAWNPSQPGFSVEEGIAGTLGISLGDRLRFDIAGEAVEARVTSLRRVEWDSFQVNFFVLATPGVLERFPASLITSFHWPPQRGEGLGALVRALPNLTLIDVDALLEQVQRLLDQTVRAVELLFALCLACGVIVLLAGLLASQEERRREALLLSVMGAGRAYLRRAAAAEYLALGWLAGSLAAAGAGVAAWALATQVFDLDYDFDPRLLLAGWTAGALGVTLAGAWQWRRGRDTAMALRGLED